LDPSIAEKIGNDKFKDIELNISEEFDFNE